MADRSSTMETDGGGKTLFAIIPVPPPPPSLRSLTFGRDREEGALPPYMVFPGLAAATSASSIAT